MTDRAFRSALEPPPPRLAVVTTPDRPPDPEPWSRPRARGPLDLRRLVEILYWRWPSVAWTAAATLAAALLYLALAPTRYTAEFLILVDPRTTEVLSAEASSAPDRAIDPGLIDSQVEILKSDSVLLRVARKLNLIDDPDLTLPHGLVGWALRDARMALGAWLPGESAPETAFERERAVVDLMSREMRVKRMGLTHVIQVDYRGYDPGKTAAIANAIADAYIVGELNARYSAALRTGDWLRDRIREIGDQASAADLAVETYKSAHNIIDTSRGLINEQRLADVNSQLVAAGAATAEAKARLDRILEVADSPIGNAAVADTLHSDVISRLRAEYLDLDSREADYALRFGKDHASVRNIHGQKVQIQVAAREELRRIAESTRSDYSIALARETSLKSSLEALIAAANQGNQAQGALRNLESTAQTYRNLYETMLQKVEEITRQQSFAVAGDRVITPAAPPRNPSWPRPLIVFPAAALLGLVLGCGLAVSRELLGDTLRSAEDVGEHIGLACLGIVPTLTPRPGGRAASSLLAHAVAAPGSRLREVALHALARADLRRREGEASVIGVVASRGGEGASTLAANLARLSARLGRGAVLIDADARGGGLTGWLAPDAEEGLIELLEGGAALEQAICVDADTGLDFIPLSARTRGPNPDAWLAPARMARLIAELRLRYDIVVIDLPPLAAVAEVKAHAGLIDQFVVVAEWGRASRDAVRDSLDLVEEARERAIGIVLNKADPGALRRIERRVAL